MIEFDVRSDLNLTYYLSGPMSGLPKYNYPAFERAALRLRRMGMKIVSPHEIPPSTVEINPDDKDAVWDYYMAKCEKQFEQCDAIIMLRGWPESRGARRELGWAIEKGKPVFLFLESPGRLVRMSKRD